MCPCSSNFFIIETIVCIVCAGAVMKSMEIGIMIMEVN